LGCDATNDLAVAKLIQLKAQPINTKMIVLVASERTIMRHATQLDLGVFDYLDSCSSPTTVIYNGVIDLAASLLGEDNKVGMRITNHLFCKHLIKRFQKPIVSTCANVYGTPIPEKFSDINPAIIKGVDYCVSEECLGASSTGKPSIIITWEKGEKGIVVRE
jgi:L-threonylcarbamoyladenylate synthase